MNEKIDNCVEAIECLCQAYKIGEGQLEIIFKLTEIANKLSIATREYLGYSDVYGKVVVENENDRDG